MKTVAKYTSIQSANEAIAILSKNGIAAEVFDATSNARSWTPHGSSVMSDYWILGREEDSERIKELLKSNTGNPERVKELSKQFERSIVIYLFGIAICSVGLSFLPSFDVGTAIVVSVAIATSFAWWKNRRKSRQNQSSHTTPASAPR